MTTANLTCILRTFNHKEPNMIASEFKAKREAANLTQEQLAGKMGCTARTVRNYENGTGSLPDRAVKMLKLVLKLK